MPCYKAASRHLPVVHYTIPTRNPGCLEGLALPAASFPPGPSPALKSALQWADPRHRRSDQRACRGEGTSAACKSWPGRPQWQQQAAVSTGPSSLHTLLVLHAAPCWQQQPGRPDARQHSPYYPAAAAHREVLTAWAQVLGCTSATGLNASVDPKRPGVKVYVTCGVA